MNTLNIHILGDKDGFFSKNCLNRFKLKMKSEYKNYKNLYYLYIKPEYQIELIEESDLDIKFNIIKIDVISKNKIIKKKNIVKKNNNDNKDIPQDIIKIYDELKKYSKIPIPSPSEILNNSVNYKEIISNTLSDFMIQKLGNNHPYIKYFKLFLKYINNNNINTNTNNLDNLDNNDNINTNIDNLDTIDNINNLDNNDNINNLDTIDNTKINKINRDEDTDED